MSTKDTKNFEKFRLELKQFFKGTKIQSGNYIFQ